MRSELLDRRVDLSLAWISTSPREVLEALLTPEERRARAQFRTDAVRRRYTAARALVRVALSRRTDHVRPWQWALAPSPRGRPEIVAPRLARRLWFSVSHAGDLVGCAVAAVNVGLDLEDLHARTEPTRPLHRFLAPAEASDLASCSDGEQDRRFFALWTLKEAYLKARGEGLRLPLDDVAFTIGSGGEVGATFAARVADEAGRWHFDQRWLTPSHVVALAIERDPVASFEIVVHEAPFAAS